MCAALNTSSSVLSTEHKSPRDVIKVRDVLSFRDVRSVNKRSPNSNELEIRSALSKQNEQFSKVLHKAANLHRGTNRAR